MSTRAKILSINISNIMGMDNMKIALRMLPVVNSCSLPVTAIQKYLINFFMDKGCDDMM